MSLRWGSAEYDALLYMYELTFIRDLHRAQVWRRGGSRTSIAGGGGALVTNEAEVFTEARNAERGRVGEGVTPSRWWGSGGLPREILGYLHQNSAFWAHLDVTYAHIYNWKYIWKTCLTINILFKIPLVFKFTMEQFFVLYYESDFTVIPFNSLLWSGPPKNFWKFVVKMVQS